MGMLHLYLSFIAIFMLTALQNLLTACLPPSCGIAAPVYLLSLIPILSNSLMQELTSTVILSFLSLVNSGTLFLLLYFHLAPRPPLLFDFVFFFSFFFFSFSPPFFLFGTFFPMEHFNPKFGQAIKKKCKCNFTPLIQIWDHSIAFLLSFRVS